MNVRIYHSLIIALCTLAFPLKGQGMQQDSTSFYHDPDTLLLDAAGVTAKVELIQFKNDKVVMNVSQSAFAQGSNALELMKKAPGVTIDKDGNVKLNGKAVSVWIDGRPSYLDGKSLEALLRGTSSESIDKFELIEHPSSKYDASGQGGIINIKTKKNFKNGLSGSMGMGGGGMYVKETSQSPWQQTLWANLAYRTKKTNTFLNINEGMYKSPSLMVNDLTIAQQSFHQLGNTEFEDMNHNYSLKAGNDWFIDDKNTFGVILFGMGVKGHMNSVSSKTIQEVNGVKVQEANAYVKNGPSNAARVNLNLNYTHIFDEARNSEITVNADYYHNLSKDVNCQDDTTFLASLPDIPVLSRKEMNADQIYDIYSAKADYQSVVWEKFMLESGAKWALSRTDNNSVERQTNMPDRLQDLIYSEQVAAAYGSLAGQIGAKWSFKAGLRGEFTHAFGDWRSSGTQTTRNYFDLFPTAYIGFAPNEKWRLSASYTRRIDRPRYGMLNPAKTYVDAKTYVTGNPDLLPQYSNDLFLSAGFGQHLSISIGYNKENNILNQVPSFNTDGSQSLTWGNIGKQHLGYLSFGLSALPIGKWLQWTVNMNGLYINSISSISDYTTNCWSGQGYTDFTFILPKDWKIDLDAFYMAPMTVGYFKVKSMWQSNLAVKKNLLDNKLTLTLRFDDMFRSMNQDIEIFDVSGSGAATRLLQKYYQQKIMFDITWNFGSSQKPSRRRNVGNLEEMSRVGGSNSAGGASIGK